MRKLVCLLVSVCGFLQSVTLPSLYPTFLPGDFSPYLVAQIMSPGSLQFNVTSQTAYSVALNATTVGGYLGNQTVTLPALSTGVTQMSISNGVSVYTFVLLVSSVSKFTHTVTVGSTFCAPNCGNFAYSLPMTVGASTQMQGMIFNYVSRLVHWTPILGSQSFPTVAWDNYVIVLEGSGVALHSGYSSARSNEIVSMVWNTTLGFSDFFVTPRFHPEQMSYTLLPMLDSVVGFGVTLAVTCSGACNIAISSQNANFGTITTTSAVASLPINLPVNDTVIVTSTDPSGILSTNYYAIAVNAKSRNRFLSALAMYIAPVGSSYVSDTDYNSLFLAVQSDSLLQFNQPFSTVTLSYTLPNFDYNSTLLLVVVANAESALSTLSIRSNNTSLTDYWSSTKTFSPVIGPNVISVIVIAQDVGYSSIVNIAFRMRANNTNIDVLSIGGGSWSSPFTAIA